MGCGQSKKKNNSSNENSLKLRDAKKDKDIEKKEYEIKICLLGDVSVGKHQ